MDSKLENDTVKELRRFMNSKTGAELVGWRVTNSKLWSKDRRAGKLKKLNMVDRAKIRGPKADFGCGMVFGSGSLRHVGEQHRLK